MNPDHPQKRVRGLRVQYPMEKAARTMNIASALLRPSSETVIEGDNQSRSHGQAVPLREHALIARRRWRSELRIGVVLIRRWAAPKSDRSPQGSIVSKPFPIQRCDVQIANKDLA
jgi:hypothetical protein